MLQFLVTHWNIAMPIAVAILNIIALIAILVAQREIRKASSELATLRVSRAFRYTASLDSIIDNANL